MAERVNKISFALKSIPIYKGDSNLLRRFQYKSNFISSVNTVQELFET